MKSIYELKFYINFKLEQFNWSIFLNRPPFRHSKIPIAIYSNLNFLGKLENKSHLIVTMIF